MSDRPVTVRLPETVIRDLMGLTVLDESTLADQIRKATTCYVDMRLSAPDLTEQVRNAKARQNDTLRSLTRV